MINLKGIIENFLIDFSPRQKNIIEERFSLKGKKLTLAAIGKKYGLTRERIRQIEAGGLESIRKKFNSSQANRILEVSLACLKKNKGVRKEEDFIGDLKNLLKDNSVNHWQLRFIFEVAGRPYYYRNDRNFNDFWYLNEESLKIATDFIGNLEKFLKSKKEEISEGEKLDVLLPQISRTYNLDRSAIFNYIAISKKFKISPYGDFGLACWEEINPKIIKSKAYLVLKKHKKALHFRDITSKINEAKFDQRMALTPTVHNELIKDPRFVLVGRGMYGLSEFGYQPGTAKDVIAHILKNKGPLPAKEIVNLTQRERLLKENTIILNLQNKKHFKKLPDGRYHLA